MKKIINLLLSAILTATMGITTLAADTATAPTLTAHPSRDYTEAEDAAGKLKSLGLFKGVSENDFDLDRAPTRTEVVIMLIRSLGKETEALEADYAHPFTDVADWADPYIGYAYEKGLANGISDTEFGAGNDANAAVFLTFVLRSLGYSDVNGDDFTWDNPFELASEVGILTDNVNTVEFFRADVAIVTYNALEATVKDTDTTLASKLMDEGVFTSEQYAAVSGKEDKKYTYRTDFTDYTFSDGLDENGFFAGIKASDYVDLSDIYKNFPNAAKLLTVTAEDIAEEIENLISDYITYEEITDRAVAEGDLVDVTLACEASAFGMTIFDTELGQTQIDISAEFLDEELENLESLQELGEMFGLEADEVIEKFIAFATEVIKSVIGSNAGDVCVVTLALPTDIGFGEPVDLEFEFTVVINYICGEKNVPEFDDIIAVKLGYESKEAALADISEYLAEAKKESLVDTILTSIEVKEIPDPVASYFINGSLSSLLPHAEYYGINIEKLVTEHLGYDNLDAFAADIVELGKGEIEYALICQAIAENVGITVSAEMLADEYYGSLAEFYGEAYAKFTILQELVWEYLMGLYE